MVKVIIIGESLPIKTVFENSIEYYWKNSRDGKINLELLEKIKIKRNELIKRTN